MTISLQKATFDDCPLIHEMQVVSFQPLLEKYKDYETNPGAEPLERVVRRMEQPFTDYYFIVLEKEKIGVLRVIRLDERACRIGPVYVLPEYQNKGHAQRALLLAETLYPFAARWELGTILQEEKLCHFYEKLGYRRIGVEQEIQPGMTIVHYEKHSTIDD